VYFAEEGLTSGGRVGQVGRGEWLIVFLVCFIICVGIFFLCEEGGVFFILLVILNAKVVDESFDDCISP